jgi:hypothetical protein
MTFSITNAHCLSFVYNVCMVAATLSFHSLSQHGQKRAHVFSASSTNEYTYYTFRSVPTLAYYVVPKLYTYSYRYLFPLVICISKQSSL